LVHCAALAVKTFAGSYLLRHFIVSVAAEAYCSITWYMPATGQKKPARPLAFYRKTALTGVFTEH
jgi:hypothetical protein